MQFYLKPSINMLQQCDSQLQGCTSSVDASQQLVQDKQPAQQHRHICHHAEAHARAM